ncbi:NAD(P)H dehydrogenase (quinone) [Methylocella silvestris BL2]|uniref:NAD(P)H dehydrogenase (Quinone) n=1 Tax=Methylocella silvestris (strain DSM 15510 / CIP 108128 / LMG 27833 / NCIMB 13906 / BL2) TaxID=395965 RepID=B8EP88_METSB|nr:NAD(P)H-dependent oxidoreductase [Methylocella silvestris]ACK49676.1 NAD(P)H dehydrogenase (quinone) [Methylocella silvestris BL2]
MRALIVLAHPVAESFAHAAAARVGATLEARGMSVDLLDLYADDFDPRLSAAERRAYFTPGFDAADCAPYGRRLQAARKLVFIFPQWWFGVPAILKGFFDRALAPGVAFAHQKGGGLTPLLTHIDALWAVSSTGSPWFVTNLIAGDPARRDIARGVKPWICPKASFRSLTLHGMDAMTRERGARFLDRLEREFQRF